MIFEVGAKGEISEDAISVDLFGERGVSRSIGEFTHAIGCATSGFEKGERLREVAYGSYSYIFGTSSSYALGGLGGCSFTLGLGSAALARYAIVGAGIGGFLIKGTLGAIRGCGETIGFFGTCVVCGRCYIPSLLEGYDGLFIGFLGMVIGRFELTIEGVVLRLYGLVGRAGIGGLKGQGVLDGCVLDFDVGVGGNFRRGLLLFGQGVDVVNVRDILLWRASAGCSYYFGCGLLIVKRCVQAGRLCSFRG